VWLGHCAALHSHATLHPHFASPGLCYAKPLFGLAKRRQQPKRYTTYHLKFIGNKIKNYTINCVRNILKKIEKNNYENIL
jgi:hypothetical protein